MRFFIFIFFFFSWQGIIAQETYTPTKIQENEVTLDGILSEKIWKNATKIPVDIEFSPANNLQAKKKTTAYISYSDTFLFIAVHAEDDPKNIRASIMAALDSKFMLNVLSYRSSSDKAFTCFTSN